MTHDVTLPAAGDLPERAERDPHRPRFHFTAPGGWLNDPNGVGHWGGVYHLFYQYNPYAPVHQRIHWGHATSRDLVTWTDEPVALVPDDEGPDAEGCWSGVLVDDDGVPTLVYSGHQADRQLPCLATGTPDLRTWKKDPANPVIAAPPSGVDVPAFRDHCVWREKNGRWRQLIGSGIKGTGGAAFLYESEDLRSWRYVGPLLVGDAVAGPADAPDWTGTMWECVDLFRLTGEAREAEGGEGTEGTDVLVFSAWDEGTTHHPLYWTGRYAGDTFEPSGLHRLDYGQRHFYAPQSFRDDAGRRIMFGWLQEARPDEQAVAAGWSGVMSLPRLLTLGADGLPAQRPVPEVDALRRDHVGVGPFRLGGDEELSFDGVAGDQLDLELTLRLAPGATARVTVRATPDGSERTVIEIGRGPDGSQGTLRLLREASSLDTTVDTPEQSGELPLGDEGLAEVRVLIDHSALEVFANGRALTSRVYPTRPDALGVGFGVTNGIVAVERLDAWRMGDIWEGARPLWP